MSLIVGYLGRRGRGKSLSMVKDAYNYFCRGWHIYTNMLNVNFPTEVINNIDVLDMAERDEFSHCVIAIDELQVIINSRRSQRDENVLFLNFIEQIRKRNVILLYTTQFNKRVDIGIRDHLDIEAYPRMLIVGDNTKNPLCEVTYVDITSQEEPPFILESRTLVYEAKQVFNLYDDKERAKIVKTEKEEDESSDDKLLESVKGSKETSVISGQRELIDYE